MTRSSHAGKTRPNDIAIVGISVWYPGAVSVTEFWENILAKRQQFRSIPDERLPKSEYYSEDKLEADKTYGQEAAVIDGFEYDWQSRRIPKRTFESTDLVHWLALEVALKALDDSKLDLNKLKQLQTGVILGNTLTGEWTRTNAMRLRWPFFAKVMRETAMHRGLESHVAEDLIKHAEHAFKSVFPAVNEDTLAGALSNTIAGRICNYLDIHGGGFTVDGACSSSLLAVLTAAQHLSSGQLDVAFAGGIDISLDTFELIGFAKTGALTSDEMRVYDKRANGFIPGEGCGFMVLKRLEDAQRDQDQIYAVIKGWGLSSDGKGGLTAPSIDGQAQAIKKAYDMAGYQIKDLSFVEGHGTGTTLGDKVEISALQKVLSLGDELPNQKIAITSLKSIVGHTKAAAGIGALIKATLGVNQRIIPPLAGVEDPNALFEDHATGFYPAIHGKKLPESDLIRAGVSAMGFGGINTHVTLESYGPPAEHIRSQTSEKILLNGYDRSEVVTFTAPSQTALVRMITLAIEETKGMSRSELSDYAFERSRLSRNEDKFRAVVVTKTPKDLVVCLTKISGWIEAPLKESSVVESKTATAYAGVTYRGKSPKIGLIFPGQGSQKNQMGLSLVQRYPWAEIKAHKAQTLIQSQFGIDLLKTLEDGASGTKSLRDTEVSQPAISLVNALTSDLLGLLGIKPSVVSGHSLGELSALYSCGSINFEQLIQLSAERGSFMGASQDQAGTMGFIACNKTKADELIQAVKADSPEGYMTLANHNAPDQVVVSGDTLMVNALVELCQQHGIKAGLLPVSNAFHSRYMDQGSKKFRARLESHVLAQPRVPFIKGTSGAALEPHEDLRSYLESQITHAVDFVTTVTTLASQCDIIIEAGPGSVLSGLTRKVLAEDEQFKDKKVLSTLVNPYQDFDLKTTLAVCFVSGLSINWSHLFTERFFRPFIPAHQKTFIGSPTEKKLAFLGDKIVGASASASRPMPALTITESQKSAESSQSHQAISNVQYPVAHPQVSPMESHLAVAPRVAMAAPSTASATKSDILESIYLEVSALTGFDRNTLHPDMSLLDDLHLDSIKATELIGNISMQYQIAAELANMQLNNAKLSELVELVVQYSPNGQSNTEPTSSPQPLVDAAAASHLAVIPAPMISPAPAVVPAQVALHALAQPVRVLQNPSSLTPKPSAVLEGHPSSSGASGIAHTSRAKNRAPWTRNFSEVYVETPLETVAPLYSWLNEKVLVVAPSEMDLVDSIPLPDLIRAGAQVETHFEGQGPKAGLNLQAYSTVIIVMPSMSGPRATSSSGLTATKGGDTDTQTDGTIRLLASVAQGRFAKSQKVVFVQHDDGVFGQESPLKISAKAFAQSLAHERQDLVIRVLSFHREISSQKILSSITAELGHSKKIQVAGYKATGLRVTPELQLDRPAEYTKRSLEWSPMDVVIVTGGAKGITDACTFEFARKNQVKIALVGSTVYPSEKDNTSTPGPISATLRRYHEAGLTAQYFSCDITNPSQVEKLVSSVQASLGKVTGIIHGAGVNQPRLLQTVDFAAASKEVQPKLKGLSALLQMIDPSQLKMVSALTSVIGVVGMPGNGWYGFANENLDLFLRQVKAKHPHLVTQTFAYSVWSEIGMGARLGSDKVLEDKGISAIPPHEGVARFLMLLDHKGRDQQTIITSRLGSVQLSAS